MNKISELTGLSAIQLMHYAIGIGIMLFGRFVPPFTAFVPSTEKLVGMGFPLVDGQILLSITPIGMLVLSIFLGIIYLWTFADSLWPSFLGIFLLGISEYAPMAQVLNSFMGNAQVVLLFMLYIFCAALVRSQVATYIARYFMTRKIIEGRPWIFSAVILLTCYLVAFLDQISSVFLMWPVLYIVFQEVGFQKGDKYVSLMMVNSVLMIVLSFATDAIKGGAFLVISSLYAISSANPDLNIPILELASYLLFGIVLSLIIMGILLFTMRFVYRVDIEPLKKFNIEVLRANKLPPMNWKQKTILFLFLFYSLCMILPGILPSGWAVSQFFQANQFGMSLFTVFLVTIIQYKGEALIDLPQIMSAFPWRVFFLVAVAFVFGGAVSAPSTNIPVMLEYVLRELFTGLGYTELVVATVILALLITNFSNSVVSGIIFAPVLVALCNAYGFTSAPLLACFFFMVLVGLITPAASPFAAMLYGNKDWIDSGDAMHYASVGSLISLAVVVLFGVPLAQILF